MWTLPAVSDHINEVCRRLHEGEGIDDLLAQARFAHAQLQRAVASAANLDLPCFKRATGEVMTGRERLEGTARHWAQHIDELQAVGP